MRNDDLLLKMPRQEEHRDAQGKCCQIKLLKDLCLCKRLKGTMPLDIVGSYLAIEGQNKRRQGIYVKILSFAVEIYLWYVSWISTELQEH